MRHPQWSVSVYCEGIGRNWIVCAIQQGNDCTGYAGFANILLTIIVGILPNEVTDAGKFDQTRIPCVIGFAEDRVSLPRCALSSRH